MSTSDVSEFTEIHEKEFSQNVTMTGDETEGVPSPENQDLDNETNQTSEDQNESHTSLESSGNKSGKKKESQGLFVCGLCSGTFNNKGRLAFHMKRKHNQEKPFSVTDLTCYLCYKTFSQRYNLLRHISRVHKKEKPYFCHRCEKRFSDKRAMIHHRDYQHSDYRCKLCGITFDDQDEFGSHKCCAVFIEGSEKPYGCLTCKKWFGNGSKLHLHVKTHSYIEEDSTVQAHYTCGICTVVLNTRRDFNEHMKIHTAIDLNPESKITPETFVYQPEQIVVKKIDSVNGRVMVECDVCGKTLSINSIQKHKKIHNGELNMSVCTICGKVLSNPHNLRRHMKSIHQNVRSFCCEFCGKLFAEKRTMTSHVHSQHGEHVCPQCGISFKDNASLLEHECLAITQDANPDKILHGCKKCEKFFDHKCKLRRHIEKHLNMPNTSKTLSTRSKLLVERYTRLQEEMENTESNETDGENSVELEIGDQTEMIEEMECKESHETDGEDSVELEISSQTKIKQKTTEDSQLKNGTENCHSSKGNIHFCEKCNAMFASVEDFKCHQAWHEDTSLDTDEGSD